MAQFWWRNMSLQSFSQWSIKLHMLAFVFSFRKAGTDTAIVATNIFIASSDCQMFPTRLQNWCTFSQFLGTLVAFLTWDVPHTVDDGKDDVDEHGQRSVSLFDTGRDFCWVICDWKTPQVWMSWYFQFYCVGMFNVRPVFASQGQPTMWTHICRVFSCRREVVMWQDGDWLVQSQDS